MTRVRTTSPAGTIADYVSAANRPPSSMLPASINKLATEYDNLVGQEGQARSALMALHDGWIAGEKTARKADGATRIAAVRGDNPDPGTPAQDALAADLAAAKSRAAAYADAIRATAFDIAAARDQEWEKNHLKHETEEQKARAAVKAAATQLETAVQTLTAQIGLREWYCADRFDPSCAINFRELAVEAGQAGTNRGISGDSYFTIGALTRVINNL